MKRLFLFFICLLLYGTAAAQNSFPVITENDFAGIKINRTEYYDGSSLWGYIDGGADLYLEYGFTRLAAQEVVLNSAKYKIDIYKMNNAEAAFGIYSISRFKCSGKTISKYSCLTEYQVTAAKGSYYISIANEKGSAEEQLVTQNIASKILSRIDEKEYETGDFFKAEPYGKGEIKFFNGILSVQNAASDWESLFEGISKFSLTLSSADDKDGYIMWAVIKFSTPDDAAKFSRAGIARNGSGITTSCVKRSDTEILFTETNKK